MAEVGKQVTKVAVHATSTSAIQTAVQVHEACMYYDNCSKMCMLRVLPLQEQNIFSAHEGFRIQ